MAKGNGHKGLSVRLFIAAAIIMALTPASCRHDEIDYERPLVTLYPIVDSRTDTVVETRALGANYTPYDNNPESRQRIYAYAVAFDNIENNDIRVPEKDAKGYFSPVSVTNGLTTSHTWRSTLMVENNTNYYIYGHTAIPGVEWPTNADFSFTDLSHVTVSFKGIDIVSNTDPLVCRASAGKKLIASDTEEYLGPDDLTEGVFEKIIINESAEDQQNGNTTKVFMALDHLYAKVNLSLRMDNSNANNVYNDLRTIKVKDVSICTDKGRMGVTNENSRHTLDMVTGVLTLSSDKVLLPDTELSPSVLNGPSSTAVKEEDGTLVLTTDYKDAGWFTFLPIYADEFHNNIPELNLKVLFDVYDKTGVKIRENCTAVNKNILKKIYNPQKGYCYNIKISVKPTYLYQLSDTDVDFELELLIED